MAYFPFDLADMEFALVLPLPWIPFIPSVTQESRISYTCLLSLDRPASVESVFRSTSHKGRPGDASFHAERGIKAVLLLQKTSLMGSFPGLQQHQSYGLPAPETPYGLFHAAGYQQPNLPRQKNQAPLRLQSHDTMSLPTAVTNPVQKSRKRAPPVMKSFSPDQRLKVSRNAGGLRKSFLPMDNGQSGR